MKNQSIFSISIKIKSTLLLSNLLFALTLTGQPEISWQKCLGGSDEESDPICVKANNSNNMFFIGGETWSNDGDVSGYHYGTELNIQTSDIWAVKVLQGGEIVWEKCLGGTENETLIDTKATSDNGFILLGSVKSGDGNVSGYHEGYIPIPIDPVGRPTSDSWVVKLTESGAIQWQKCLGGTLNERPRTLALTADGGCIVGSDVRSSDGDVIGFHPAVPYALTDIFEFPYSDIWVVKLNGAGTIEWQKCLGGDNEDRIEQILPTSDGGYIVCGYSASNNGDVSGSHSPGYNPVMDIWVVKLNSAGDIEWQRCYGGSDYEYGRKILETDDGGYLLMGITNSNDGDVIGYHQHLEVEFMTYSGAPQDIWLLKLDNIGNIEWQKCYGGSTYDSGNDIQSTQDGGYIIVGVTKSNNGDVNGNHGEIEYPNIEAWNSDIWVVKVDSFGDLQWQRCLGSDGSEGVTTSGSLTSTTDRGTAFIEPLNDGTFFILDRVRENSGDVNGVHGGVDMWGVKLNADGEILWQKCLGGTDYEYHSKGVLESIDGTLTIIGSTWSEDGDVTNLNGGSDLWLINLSETGTEVDNVFTPKAIVFPIPASSLITVETNSSFPEANYHIFDISGRQIMNGSLNSQNMSINIESLPTGVFTLKIDLNQPQIFRFIKE